MKKRYSNFHRARKYHRKAVSKARRNRRSMSAYYLKLFKKYEKKIFHEDGLMTGFRKEDDRYVLVITTHMDAVFDKIEKHVKKYPLTGDNPEGYFVLDSYVTR